MKTCTKCGQQKTESEFCRVRGKPGARCKQCKRVYQNAWNEKNRDRKLVYCQNWRDRNRDKLTGYNKFYELKILNRALRLYGGKCACCWETDLSFLTIDHPEFDHRNSTIYKWLKKRKYPKGATLHCFNCAGSIKRYGKCSHNKLKSYDKNIQSSGVKVSAA